MQKPIIKNYSDQELDKCRFLHLIFKTTGLENPKPEQKINYLHACSECKSGRIFDKPLKISRNTMGKKKIDQNGRFGFIVMQKDLIEYFRNNGIMGLEYSNIELGRNQTDFQKAEIVEELPPMSVKSVVKKYQICRTCGRSGHYNYYDRINEIWFKKHDLDNLSNDVYRTWEYYGIWDMGQNFQSIIVSQKFRQLLKDFKLRHIKYEPIFEE